MSVVLVLVLVVQSMSLSGNARSVFWYGVTACTVVVMMILIVVVNTVMIVMIVMIVIIVIIVMIVMITMIVMIVMIATMMLIVIRPALPNCRRHLTVESSIFRAQRLWFVLFLLTLSLSEYSPILLRLHGF